MSLRYTPCNLIRRLFSEPSRCVPCLFVQGNGIAQKLLRLREVVDVRRNARGHEAIMRMYNDDWYKSKPANTHTPTHLSST